MLINDNTEELKKYSKLLKSKGIDVTTGMFGKDCIDKIKYGEVYDLILIDDEMQPYNAIETYNELKKDINFKTKVIIMLGLNKEFINVAKLFVIIEKIKQKIIIIVQIKFISNTYKLILL